MQYVKLLWVVNFFFFALILFFIWSKITILSKRLTSLKKAFDSVKATQEEVSKAAPQSKA
jgi:large-conductance mechanosensitive channel